MYILINPLDLRYFRGENNLCVKKTQDSDGQN